MNVLSRIRQVGWVLLASGALLAPAVSQAQAGSPMTVTSTVYQEVEVQAANGTSSTRLEPAERVAPGGVVVYEISYRNNGAQPVKDFAINNPLPPELEYLGASVDPSVVSVDGGEHFAPLSELTVASDDGGRRPARAADVTNLRWTIANVDPNAAGKVTFRARVK